MEAEFGTVAEWTAEVAEDLGPDYHVPAGCRGSGSPAALDWLIDRMGLAAGDRLLDCGAGVGGPAAYAARAGQVLPVLAEPEAGACRAARRLFGFPVVQADASRLPLADSSFDAAWSLGVLCTTADQIELLRELRRTVSPDGAIGLLVFVARGDISDDMTEGNHFPSPDGLRELVQDSALDVEHWLRTADLPEIPDDWNERVDAVTDALADRYGQTEAWQLADQQSAGMGRLLKEGAITGELLVLRRA
ncbi:SAM-dependent methyltransferase [Mycobacterium parmense]|uniref:SAM-dependent methyltransferase n=2 Tax=Mycobacterium parmense TaxID=185642 RepID=A0A7I7YY32_9MYCO|nr:SAM-dependent methyltransferase [Mycobacterium parmense]